MVCGLLVATLGILPPPQSLCTSTGYVATARSRTRQPFLTFHETLDRKHRVGLC